MNNMGLPFTKTVLPQLMMGEKITTTHAYNISSGATPATLRFAAQGLGSAGSHSEPADSD
jgi:hypothetical protein